MRVIIDGVEYVPVDKQPESTLRATVNYFLEDLVSRIRDGRKDAQSLYDDVKKDGLTFNTMEAEGNLRAYVTMCNLIDHLHNEFYSEVTL